MPSCPPCQPTPTRWPFFQTRDVGAQLVYDAGDFVTWHARIRDARPLAFFGQHVAVANSAGLHFDAAHGRAGGEGISRSTSSNSAPGVLIWATFIFGICGPPRVGFRKTLDANGSKQVRGDGCNMRVRRTGTPPAQCTLPRFWIKIIALAPMVLPGRSSAGHQRGAGFVLPGSGARLRTTLKIVLPLIISVAVVSLLFAAYQVRTGQTHPAQ